MRLYTILAILAALLMSSTNAQENQLLRMATSDAKVWTADSHVGQTSNIVARNLRSSNVDKIGDESVRANEEERGILGTAKLKAWLALGKDPAYVYKKLKVSGVGEKVFEHKNWPAALEFWKMWHAKQAAKLAEQLKKSG